MKRHISEMDITRDSDLHVNCELSKKTRVDWEMKVIFRKFKECSHETEWLSLQQNSVKFIVSVAINSQINSMRHLAFDNRTQRDTNTLSLSLSLPHQCVLAINCKLNLNIKGRSKNTGPLRMCVKVTRNWKWRLSSLSHACVRYHEIAFDVFHFLLLPNTKQIANKEKKK